MLSRSSLETQKLELMSAMSELKLQQAALERENLELRSNFLGQVNLNGGSTNNLNNNVVRRAPLSNSKMFNLNTSTGNSLHTSPLHHGSHGNLPQSVPKVSTYVFYA